MISGVGWLINLLDSLSRYLNCYELIEYVVPLYLKSWTKLFFVRQHFTHHKANMSGFDDNPFADPFAVCIVALQIWNIHNLSTHQFWPQFNFNFGDISLVELICWVSIVKSNERGYIYLSIFIWFDLSPGYTMRDRSGISVRVPLVPGFCVKSVRPAHACCRHRRAVGSGEINVNKWSEIWIILHL